MQLYTERHGIRKPVKQTYEISKVVYEALLNSCEKHYINLIHLFNSEQHDDFTNGDYIKFNYGKFNNKIKIKIPKIYRNEYGNICKPGMFEEYNQYSLIDYIEYIAKNIKDISQYWNNDQYKNYKIINCLKTDDVFKQYKKEINEIFQDSGVLFKLTDDKIVERIVENSILTSDIEEDLEKISEDETKKLMKDAIALYKTPAPNARQDSVEKLWDAFERLKTYYISLNKKQSITKITNDMSNGNTEYYSLFDEEFKELTSIGNKFRIRHHEMDRIDITDFKYYDYFFNRCLSLIALSIQYLK